MAAPRRRLLAALALCLAPVLVACSDDGGTETSSATTNAETPNPRPEAQPLEGRPAEGAKVGQHWHAAFGVDLCGEWLSAPEFHEEIGIHSHGDGLVHIHPFVAAGAGRKATMEKFFTGGGWEVTEDSFNFGGTAVKRNGDPCPDGRPGVVRWSVNGVEQEGDLSDFVPFDGDVIALAFIPEGDPIPEPPHAKQALQNIGDLSGAG